MMQAAVFKTANTPWAIETVADPIPLAGEAVIKVGRCGICGTDLNMTSGKGYDFPCESVLGHEYAGEVVALAKDVSTLKIGDIVTAMPAAGCGDCPMCHQGSPLLCAKMTGYMGGFAEYMRIAERVAVKLPAALSLADGALVEPLAVGLHGVALAAMPMGARVLVLGAGAIGLAVIYHARRLGAGRIVSAARTLQRAELAELTGADASVALGDGEAERIAAALGGPPDYVFECAGAVGLLGQAVNLVRPNGTIISLGFCMAPDPVIPGIATYKQVKLIFSMAYTLPEFQHVTDMLDRGAVEARHMITETIGLDALPAMIDALRANNTQAKVQVNPWN
jgi:threonine dehydrogenase-like Zn-dependent dehydrogenase